MYVNQHRATDGGLLKNWMVVVLFAIILAVGVLASMDTYVVRDSSSETVLWNSSEAFLFVSTVHRGYKFSKLAYILEIVKEYFNIVPSPNNESYATQALKTTSDTTYRYPSQAILLNNFRSVDHLIYASHEREVWKFGDDGFVKMGKEEPQQ